MAGEFTTCVDETIIRRKALDCFCAPRRKFKTVRASQDLIASALGDPYGFARVRARRPRVARPERQTGAGQRAASANSVDDDAQFIAAPGTPWQASPRLRDRRRDREAPRKGASNASRSLAARAAAGS